MKFIQVTLLVVLVAGLGGCGGGSNTATTASVSSNSKQTASALGATSLSTSTVSKFNTAADIGDTWRFEFDSSHSTYALHVGDTQFGITDTTGSYASATSGDFTTYTLGNGAGTIVVDNRTLTLAGDVKIGNKTTTITGTGYEISDLSKLAGTYNFYGSSRNKDTSSPEFHIGQIKIGSDGTTATLCRYGTVNADNTCANIYNATPIAEKVSLTLGLDSSNPTQTLIRAKVGTTDFGIISVSAGDRGAVLILDEFYSASGGTRVGNLYAVKQQPLTGDEMKGSWVCTENGDTENANTMTVSNISSSWALSQEGVTTTTPIAINKVKTSTSDSEPATMVLNGFVVLGPFVDGTTNTVFPVSSSLMIGQGDKTQTVVCRPKQ